MFQRNLEKRKTFQGFTLAEVLITLGIIGVVAAVTMPMLIANINERVNSERQANIVYKITQAMEHMRAQGKLTAYDSTESFVNELQKHLKIQKICDKDHLTECWPTNTVNTSDGEKSVANAKTGNMLDLKRTSNNVGLILADGASVILNYNPEFEGYDIGDKVTASTISLPTGKNKSKVFQYTTNVTAPIAFVMDVNGKKGPNAEIINGKSNDVRNFNGAAFYQACEDGPAGCVYYFGTSYAPVNCSEGNSSSDDYQTYCGPRHSGFATDYWAGAKKVCDEAGWILPNVTQLASIYENRNSYHFIAQEGRYFTSEEATYSPGRNYNPHNPKVDALIHDFSVNYQGGQNKYDNESVLCIKE